MTFAEYCQQNNDAILKTIVNYLPEREPLGHYQVAREYTLRKGKYARPNLALLWTELFGESKEIVFPFACGIQMAEDWFLMQDDWMDQNEMRRGKPTAHLLYGASATINASNSVQASMWKMVHEGTLQTHPRPPVSGRETTTRLFDKFYDIINVTIEGQYLDLKLTERKITDFTLEDYWQSIHAKAAYYSVYGPMQLGAISAGQPENVVEKIADYGEKIGRAFQLKDDILDCTSNEETLGKTIGNDVLEGTKTAILWHCIQKASSQDLEKLQAIYAKKRTEKTADEIGYVLDLFNTTGSITYAEHLTDSLAKEAMLEFEKQTTSLPETELKDTARDAILKMTQREK
jgi:geranylgeranyl pyrophosphate synthase